MSSMPAIMRLKYLKVEDFRNYSKKLFEFSDNTSLIVGDNASGKTNVLEAIYLLATGRSFRATKEEQMILYGKEIGRVKGELEELELEIVLSVGEVGGQKTPKKRYLINGVGKRRMDFVGRLRAVLFRPEDIELILGSPGQRRDYLDSVLEQVDGEYRRSILAYQKGLRQRNKLLERIREGEAERKQLLFWNQILIKNGELVHKARQGFLGFVNDRLRKRELDLQLKHDASLISEARLEQYAEQEVAAGATLVGPHRDEFLFIIQRKGKAKKNLAIYGSRGEQRMAVLAVKLAELGFVHQETETKPLLLLDDIFSELDDGNRDEVLKLLPRQQTMVTSTDEKLVPKKYLKRIDLIKL